MPTEYRPVRANELTDFVYSGSVGFGESTSEERIERLRARNEAGTRLEWTLAAFDDGILASKMLTLPFQVYWNRRQINCGGVTAVTTMPTHRRRGHLRELMTRAFATMHESGQPLAMLWASMAAIYQRFGYGTASRNWTYRFNPRDLRFVDEIPTPGRVRLVRGDTTPSVIGETYERFAAQRTPMLRRNVELVPGVSWWTDVRLHRWRPDQSPYLVAAYEEDGAVLGYAIYDVRQHDDWQPGPDQELIVSDLVWLTPAAHRALIRYLTGYDLVRTIRIAPLPVDDPLFYQAQEPRLLNVTAGDGTLVRIVDLPAALAGRGYDADGRLTFGFTDDLCPWNSGVWDLQVDGGTARVRRSAGAPDLCLTPRVLAMLASGYQSAPMLARIGLLPAADARTLAAADALFHTACAPLCLDDF